MKNYAVTVTAKYPAVGERPGEIEVTAKDKKDAIKQARREMSDRGHTRQDGPLSFKAMEVNEN